MLQATLSHLRCPGRPRSARGGKSAGGGNCSAPLRLEAGRTHGQGPAKDVLTGQLHCEACRARYPILAGVAILVRDVPGYLMAHVKGILAVVDEKDLPREHARELKAAYAELQTEHIEDDLEAERVISLYLMNHYLTVAKADEAGDAWWAPRAGSGERTGDPLIARLVREHWDQGPLNRIEGMIAARAARGKKDRVIELGCGVGGLASRLRGRVQAYLGVDSSFAAIALARHLTLGSLYRGKTRIPEDLLAGPVSRPVRIEAAQSAEPGAGEIDFVVGDLEAEPVTSGEWDVSVALNAIDMLGEPARLPELQRGLLRPGGEAIQSCPYIWHESVARKLRARLPKTVRDSAGAVEWLYERAGFSIEERQDHVPWLFFKHVRQLELYSVHLFRAGLSAKN